MRTFHIGGTASTVAKVPEIVLKNAGFIKYVDLRIVRNDEGHTVVLNKNGSVQIVNADGEELDTYGLQMGTVLLADDGAAVKTVSACLLGSALGAVSRGKHAWSRSDFVDDVSVRTSTTRVGATRCRVRPRKSCIRESS
jgi:hypothetical protein